MKNIEICDSCKNKDNCINRILVRMENCKIVDCENYEEIKKEEFI